MLTSNLKFLDAFLKFFYLFLQFKNSFLFTLKCLAEQQFLIEIAFADLHNTPIGS